MSPKQDHRKVKKHKDTLYNDLPIKMAPVSDTLHIQGAFPGYVSSLLS